MSDTPPGDGTGTSSTVTGGSWPAHSAEPETRPGLGTSSAATGGFWRGRSPLIMPAVVAAFSLYLLVGGAMLDAGGAEFPGPRFVPVIVGGVGLVLALALALEVLRRPEPVADPTPEKYRTYSDFVALAWVIGGFLAGALLLPVLGWILAGALLFWCTAHGFGSRRPAFDILISLFLSSVVYLIFGTALDVALPSGIVGGGF